MGITNALRLIAAGGEILPGQPTLQPQVEAWTTSQLTSIVWADILGLAALPVSRAEALMVPAIARGTELLKATIAKWPLQAWRTDVLVTPDPPWLARCSRRDPASGRIVGRWFESWQYRAAWTVDDLIFYGCSLWDISDKGADGYPLTAFRVPWDLWTALPDGTIVDVNQRPYGPDEVAVIRGWHEGIVNFGARTIRAAALLEQAALNASGAPFRLELHQLTDAELSLAEKQELVASARAALADSGGVLFTNSAIEARDHGGAAESLLTDARNAAAVDCARLIGLPAAMIDATAASASLTYETISGRNQQFLDYGTSLYADPMAAQLSLDYVVPAGQRVAFDTTATTAAVVPAGGPPVGD